MLHSLPSLFFMYLLLFVLYSGCSNNFGKHLITMQLPTISEENRWKNQNTFIAHYIHKNGKLRTKEYAIENKRHSISVQKSGAIPIVLCVKPPVSVTGFYTLGSAGCPVAFGAVYPYDFIHDTLYFERGVKSVAARMLLLFIERKGNGAVVNVQKFYKGIEKYAPSLFLDRAAFFSYVKKNTLSVYGIKERPLFATTTLPHDEKILIRNYIQTQHTVFTYTKSGMLQVPEGMWLFVHPNGIQYALLSVNTQGFMSFKKY